ncbi:hypothetical protein BBJ28_00027070 [Nothophytophthora sp. Chile5]|nr:hypothetical protein BBJ28_00027070 [Nothophytophthora sp. Chile5]
MAQFDPKRDLSPMAAPSSTPRWLTRRVLTVMLVLSVVYTCAMLSWSVYSIHQTATSPSSSLPIFLQAALKKVDEWQRTPSPEELEVEAHALSVKLLPSGETQERQLKCIGWRATGDCSPDGPRTPENDLSCDHKVKDGASGYCEVEDVGSGERFRVMRRTCSTGKKGARFSCSEAPDFANFHVKGQTIVEKALASGFALPSVNASDGEPQAGIVMVVYPTLLASAYATIRALRDVLGCRLPIEIWYRADELRRVSGALGPLQQLAENDSMGGMTFREINDRWALRFAAKVFAIYHSNFDRVLFLDADNVPVRDPTFLLETPEFVKTGAIFWPDFWHPQYTIFHILGDSLLWQLLDMQYVNMMEQESGQVLIDRRRHAAPLELVYFYTFHRPNHFDQLKLAYGDKDLFRLAWIKLAVPFHMVQTLPAVAGKVVNGSFCGMTMVQHDTKGEVLFLHRNSNKLTGEIKREQLNYQAEARKQARLKLQRQGVFAIPNEKAVQEELKALQLAPAPTLEPPEPDGLPDPAMWTHLLSFRNTSARSHYRVQSYKATPEFPEWQRCYGQRDLKEDEHFHTQEFKDLSFSGLETHLRRFAREGVQLREAQQGVVAHLRV